MDERLQRLLNFAVQGDVDALFSIVAEDPLVLERIDEMSFVTTPVHAAVSGGKIHFVKEILNLKPSLVGRRDHLGRGLLHLALEGKHLQEGLSPRDSELVEKYQELVTFLIKIHPEVVRVKAKGMVTPWHYAAELDDETNLAEFLYVCPSSIEDLTVKSETAIHVAIKNRSFKAFKVLLGWLRHFDKEKILKWENEEGHNALHTAISENQPEPEVVKLLIKCMNVNRKNGKGLTALDIFYDLQPSLNPEVKRILLGATAKRASQLNPGPNIKTRLFLNLLGAKNYSLVDYLCGELASAEVLIRKMGLADRIISKIPLEVQNVVLVVAILIATATYQATLSPPGGFWQDDGGPTKNNTAVIKTSPFSFSSNIFLNPQFYRGQSQQVAGHMIQGSTCHFIFLDI
ncbi:hypothetical protein Patl1_19421 [Pistacia atlantica]|uniref:Uncharacterized protein n=1 Tax=Pistacia atlantica TaxID=434234 RepID=A0ACC1C2C6_9ROSI|nr:hypothetical protein Patl1_19421 [Pistacia atlantica]